MPTIPIPEAAALVMREQDVAIVMWGDGILTTIYARSGRSAHPLAAMKAVLDALGRSDLFKPHHSLGHDSKGRPRLVRSFSLIKTVDE